MQFLIPFLVILGFLCFWEEAAAISTFDKGRRFFGNCSSIFRRFFVDFLSIFRRFFVDFSSIFRRFFVDFSSIFRQFFVDVSSIFRLFLVDFCRFFGACRLKQITSTYQFWNAELATTAHMYIHTYVPWRQLGPILWLNLQLQRLRIHAFVEISTRWRCSRLERFFKVEENIYNTISQLKLCHK
jgi:hypothetical protein